MLKIKRIKCGMVNCYLIYENGRGILIDTATTGYQKRILKACRDIKVELIVLTHGHLDHAQNAAALSKELGAPIAMHEEDTRLIQDNLSEPMQAHTFLGKIVCFFSIESMKKNKMPVFKPDVFLKEGMSLMQYGINARVMQLPGHTKGSIGICVNEKYLFVGDALMHMFGVTPALLYGDQKKMLESATRLSYLSHHIIFVGHGKPIKQYR